MHPSDGGGSLILSIIALVLFMEPKALYRALKGEVPDGHYTVDLSTLRTVSGSASRRVMSSRSSPRSSSAISSSRIS